MRTHRYSPFQHKYRHRCGGVRLCVMFAYIRMIDSRIYACPRVFARPSGITVVFFFLFFNVSNKSCANCTDNYLKCSSIHFVIPSWKDNRLKTESTIIILSVYRFFEGSLFRPEHQPIITFCQTLRIKIKEIYNCQT